MIVTTTTSNLSVKVESVAHFKIFNFFFKLPFGAGHAWLLPCSFSDLFLSSTCLFLWRAGMLMSVCESYMLQTQLISVEREGVSRSSIFILFFFVSAKWRTCRDCESDAWQSCSGRLAGFPFCSAGCGCLLFPLHRAETVLIKCFKYPCEMYDKKWCSGWFWYPKPDKRSGIHGEVEHCIEYSRYSSKIWS